LARSKLYGQWQWFLLISSSVELILESWVPFWGPSLCYCHNFTVIVSFPQHHIFLSSNMQLGMEVSLTHWSSVRFPSDVWRPHRTAHSTSLDWKYVSDVIKPWHESDAWLTLYQIS
jgi:hypothetical protein